MDQALSSYIAENEMLRKRVRELEASCLNMCEVERNLHKQIKELKNKIAFLEGNK